MPLCIPHQLYTAHTNHLSKSLCSVSCTKKKKKKKRGGQEGTRLRDESPLACVVGTDAAGIVDTNVAC